MQTALKFVYSAFSNDQELLKRRITSPEVKLDPYMRLEALCT